MDIDTIIYWGVIYTIMSNNQPCYLSYHPNTQFFHKVIIFDNLQLYLCYTFDVNQFNKGVIDD